MKSLVISILVLLIVADEIPRIEHIRNVPDMPAALGAYSVGVKVDHTKFITLYAAG